MRRTTSIRVIAPHRISSMMIGDSPDIFTSTGSNLVPRTRVHEPIRIEGAAIGGPYGSYGTLFAGIIVLFCSCVTVLRRSLVLCRISSEFGLRDPISRRTVVGLFRNLIQYGPT